MDKKSELLQLIPQQGILPLYFYKDTEVSIQVLKALYQCGNKNRRIYQPRRSRLKNFREMRKVCDTELKGMYLGVGTIKDSASAQAFIDAGADYLISPGLVEDAIKVADKANMLWVPGCMTPTEIIRAEQLGARMVKLFPGNILGPSFLKCHQRTFSQFVVYAHRWCRFRQGKYCRMVQGRGLCGGNGE